VTEDSPPTRDDGLGVAPVGESPLVSAFEPNDVTKEGTSPAPVADAPPVTDSASSPSIPQVQVHLDLGRIAQDLQIRKMQVEAVVHLLDEGNTIPFITRYRKERTGGLNEDVLRQIQKRVQQQRHLADRKQTILRNLSIQGKLTDELLQAILHTDHPKRLEDLYLPFKPKKKSLAAAAREKGLGELAAAIWSRDPLTANLGELLPTVVNPEKGLSSVEDILTGVGHILAEQIAELPEIRDLGRRFLWDTARLVVNKNENVAEGQGNEFKDYFNYSESVRQVPPHRVLAINRGERENILKAKLDAPLDRLHGFALERLNLEGHPHAELIKGFALDAVNRLLAPSIEREIRRDMTERAEDHAIVVFARNLRRLLLQPPVHGQRVLAIDPAYRTGCKVAALDEYGNLLDTSTIYPFGGGPGHKWERKKKKEPKVEPATASPATASASEEAPIAPAALTTPEGSEIPPPQLAHEDATPSEQASTDPAPAPEAASPTLPAAESQSMAASEATPDRKAEAKAKLVEFAKQHHVQVIAIGNGTASRETEELVAIAITEALPGVSFIIVNEAGASHYSTSPTAREEFPSLDATARGTISIGRRLQDPLSELVKIDPQNLGVGLYQHDIAEKRLKESLEGVVESCVNYVGVDLNTASAPLLRYVAGLNQLRAHAIVDWRKEKGPFKSREQLRDVPGIGEVTWTQAAGFLRIPQSENPFDNSGIHPESYAAAAKLLEKVESTPAVLSDGAALLELRSKLQALPPEPTAQELGVGLPTYHDLIEALAKPGRDPREELPPPIFKQGLLQIEDLKPGMELKGTVQNVVDFGAFVDVGLKDSGLVHISQLANKFIKSPYDIVSVGDVVTVWVMSVDMERRRVSLTMIPPGTERRAPERRQHGQGGPPFRREPRGERQDRAPRPEGGPRPEGAPGEPRRDFQGRGEGGRRFDQRGQGRPGGGRFGGGPGGPPHGGRFGGGGGRRPFPPRQQPSHQDGTGSEAGGPGTTTPPPRPAPKRKDKPKPKLTEAALSGKAPLRTFGELKALFETRKPEPGEVPPPAPSAEPHAPVAETPAAEPPTGASPPPTPPSEAT
jgi:competence ComEA-like helix-hairpin-helix protein